MNLMVDMTRAEVIGVESIHRPEMPMPKLVPVGLTWLILTGCGRPVATPGRAEAGQSAVGPKSQGHDTSATTPYKRDPNDAM